MTDKKIYPEWVKGNTPKEPGSYELISSRDDNDIVWVDWYYGNGVWANFKNKDIVYHKPIKLSQPPERELRCPFCDSVEPDCGMTDQFAFECDSCGFKLPCNKEHIFEVYDKLKGQIV